MKKLLAFSLALIMMLSMSVSVAATGTTAPAPGPAGAITGEGVVIFTPPAEVLRMTLPTARSFQFFLDPFGFVGNPGDIVFQENFNPAFISHSTEDIRLGIEYSISGGVTVLQAAYQAGDPALGVHVEVVSSRDNVDDPAAAFVASDQVNTVHGASNRALAEYVLEAGDFTAARQGNVVVYEPSATPNWQGTQIQLQGTLNNTTPASWETAVMNMAIRFSFTTDLAGLTGNSLGNSAHLMRFRGGQEIFPTMPETDAVREVPIGFRLADGRVVDTVRVSASGTAIPTNIPIYPNHLSPTGYLDDMIVTRLRFVADNPVYTQEWATVFPWFAFGGPVGAHDSLNLDIAPGVSGVLEIDIGGEERLWVYVYVPE